MKVQGLGHQEEAGNLGQPAQQSPQRGQGNPFEAQQRPVPELTVTFQDPVRHTRGEPCNQTLKQVLSPAPGGGDEKQGQPQDCQQRGGGGGNGPGPALARADQEGQGYRQQYDDGGDVQQSFRQDGACSADEGGAAVLVVEVSAVGVAQAQPGHRVGEPPEQHQLAALENPRRLLPLGTSVVQKKPPAQATEQEGGVVHRHGKDQVQGVG